MSLLKIPIALVVMMLVCFVSAAHAQKTAAILDQIAQSLPQMDPRWKHRSTEVYKRDDASTQANIKWSNGNIERGATVIVHRSVKKARRAFRTSGKEDLHEGFRIDGVGYEAFLWPPKSSIDGAYNIRFRKAQVEVWMSGGSELDVKRYALAITLAITPTKKQIPRRREANFFTVTIGLFRLADLHS